MPPGLRGVWRRCFADFRGDVYDRLFAAEEPGGDDGMTQLNPESLEVLRGSKLESSLADAAPDTCWQFERRRAG